MDNATNTQAVPGSQELRELIADVLDIDPAAVTDDAHFIRDLGVDSLLALELSLTLERRYGVKIAADEVPDLQRLPDVRALLTRKLDGGS